MEKYPHPEEAAKRLSRRAHGTPIVKDINQTTECVASWQRCDENTT
jgi:hypothetical protein